MFEICNIITVLSTSAANMTKQTPTKIYIDLFIQKIKKQKKIFYLILINIIV